MCIWLRQFKSKFARRAIDFGLPPPFLARFDECETFNDAA
jgi:hypothetical protein